MLIIACVLLNCDKIWSIACVLLNCDECDCVVGRLCNFKMAAITRSVRVGIPLINSTSARQTVLRGACYSSLLQSKDAQNHRVQSFSYRICRFEQIKPTTCHVRHYCASADLGEQIFHILSLNSRVDSDKLKELGKACKFAEDLGLDSLAMTEVILEIEDNFGIEIPDSAYDEVKTVEDLVRYVSEKLQPA